MKPFEKAYYPPEAFDPAALARDFNLSMQQAIEMAARMHDDQVFRNDRYQVAVRDLGEVVHLSIKRIDREWIHDWRELQEIKNLLVGPECEGVELYPAESRKVDSANQYHLWVLKNPALRIPLGFAEGLVMEEPGGQAQQRPFEKQPKGEES
jgi:hypothetical protein